MGDTGEILGRYWGDTGKIQGRYTTDAATERVRACTCDAVGDTGFGLPPDLTLTLSLTLTLITLTLTLTLTLPLPCGTRRGVGRAALQARESPG